MLITLCLIFNNPFKNVNHVNLIYTYHILNLKNLFFFFEMKEKYH
jgi:hypothetical protein